MLANHLTMFPCHVICCNCLDDEHETEAKESEARSSYIDGELLFESIVEQGMEGIMAKAIDSRYTPGVRSPYWEKIKPLKTERLWAYGMTRGTGSRNLTFGALILGEYTAKPKDFATPYTGVIGMSFPCSNLDFTSFHYVGCVGSGFSDKDIAEWMNKVQPFRVPPPQVLATPLSVGPVLRWFKPEPIMVSYFERTDGGLLFPRVAKPGAK
jgi:bifunctional non-homologous end joining protein LigD